MNEATRQRFKEMGGVDTDEHLEEWNDRMMGMLCRVEKRKEGDSEDDHREAIEKKCSGDIFVANVLKVCIGAMARLASEVARTITRNDAKDEVAEFGPKWKAKPDDAPATVDVFWGSKDDGTPKEVTASFIGDDKKDPEGSLWVRLEHEAEPRSIARKKLVKETQSRRQHHMESTKPVVVIDRG